MKNSYAKFSESQPSHGKYEWQSNWTNHEVRQDKLITSEEYTA